MPVITVQMGTGQAKDKKELIRRLTSAANEVTGIPESSYIVLIEELDHDNIGLGGFTLTEKLAKQ